MRLIKSILSNACIMLAAVVASGAAGPGGVSVGARRHVDHTAFDDLPFGGGDLSFSAAYEHHENVGYWQLGISYAPDLTGEPASDYALTPQANLIFKDKFWRGGLGILGSYIRDNAGNSDWTDLYWQFIVGAHLPALIGLQIETYTYYVFEEWKELDEYELKDMEFGVSLNFPF